MTSISSTSGSESPRPGPIRLRVGALVYRWSGGSMDAASAGAAMDAADGGNTAATHAASGDGSRLELLLVRVHVPTRPDPIWMVPGGGVEPGEILEQAVLRELGEETGFELTDRRFQEPIGSHGSMTAGRPPGETILAAIHEFIEPPFHALEFYFRVDALQVGSDGVAAVPSDPQVLEVRWAPVADLSAMRLEPRFLCDPAFHLRLFHDGGSGVRIWRNGA